MLGVFIVCAEIMGNLLHRDIWYKQDFLDNNLEVMTWLLIFF